VRASCEGHWDQSLDHLYAADQQLSYRNAVEGVFKLENRLVMVEGLLAQGHGEHAHAMLAKVRAVNPTMASAFEARGLHWLDPR